MSIHTHVAAITLLVAGLSAQDQGSWNNWRGPNHNAVASTGNPPTEWNEEQGTNIKWKVKLPGRGSSSPIVWKDRIYITTAVPLDKDGNEAPMPEATGGGFGGGRGGFGGDRGGFGGDRGGERRRGGDRGQGGDQGGDRGRGGNRGGDRGQGGQDRGRGGRGGRGGGGRGGFGRGNAPTQKHDLVVIAFDRGTGKEAWRTKVNNLVPHAGTHPTGTQASNSPITDGEHIYASFGSHGIYCLDMAGKVVWSVDLGDMQTRNSFGEGSSPALHGDTLVVNWDHERDSFIVALDKKTGKERWRKNRDEGTSWSTPIVIEVEGKAQVVVTATNSCRAYDLKTGKEVWHGPGLTANVIPTPIHDGGLLYLMSGYRGSSLLVVDPKGAKGELSDKQIVWRHDRNTPYTPSGVVYDGHVYFTRVNSAILSCLDARTGEVRYEGERLGGIRTIYSSPVAAAGRVYVTGREGRTKVVKAGAKFAQIAENKVDDTVDATLAIAGDELFVRGWKNLYCIAEMKKPK